MLFSDKGLGNLGFILKTVLFSVLVIFVLYTGFYIVQKLIKDENERYLQNKKTEAVQFSSSLRTSIEQHLNERLFLISGLKAFVVASNYELETEKFESFAEAMAEEGQLVRSIQLAPAGIVSYVYPLAGNEAAVGHNLLADDQRKAQVLKAIENDDYIVTGPITLVQGGEALIARLPIYGQSGTTSDPVASAHTVENFWGFATVLIDVDSLYGIIEERLKESDYDIAIRGRHALGSEGENFYGEGSIFEKDPVLSPITLPVGSWQVAVVPKEGWPQVSPSTKGIVVLSSFLLGVLILLILSLVYGRFRAHRLVEQKTSELQASAAYQKAILDGAKYSIISVDTNGLIMSFNKGAEKLLGYSADEMMGKSPAIIHDPDEIVSYAQELTKELKEEVKPGFEVFVAKVKRGESDEKEWTYIAKSGNRIPVLLSVTALFDSVGKINGFLGVAQNVSERIEAERLAKERTTELEVMNKVMMRRESRALELKEELENLKGTRRGKEEIVKDTSFYDSNI